MLLFALEFHFSSLTLSFSLITSQPTNSGIKKDPIHQPNNNDIVDQGHLLDARRLLFNLVYFRSNRRCLSLTGMAVATMWAKKAYFNRQRLT